MEVNEMASAGNPHAHAGTGPIRGEIENYPDNQLNWIVGNNEEYPEDISSANVAKEWNKLLGVQPSNVRAIQQGVFALKCQLEAYSYLVEYTSTNAMLTVVLENWPDAVKTTRNGELANRQGVNMELVEIEFPHYVVPIAAQRKKLEVCKKIRTLKIWSSRRSKRVNFLHLVDLIKIGRIEMGWESRKTWDPLLLAVEKVLDVLSFVEPRFRMRHNRYNLGIPYRWSLLMHSREQRSKKAKGQLEVVTRRRMGRKDVTEMLNTNRVIEQYREDNEPEPRDMPPPVEDEEDEGDAGAGPAFPEAPVDEGLDGDIWENFINFPVEEPADAIAMENEVFHGRINDAYIAEMSPEERAQWTRRDGRRGVQEEDESIGSEDSRTTITEVVYIPGAEIRPRVTHYRAGYHPGTDRRIREEDMEASEE